MKNYNNIIYDYTLLITMYELPTDIVLYMTLKLPISALSFLYRTCQKFNNLISTNETFWNLKFRIDFDTMNADIASPIPWKEYYKRCGNLYVCGKNSHGQLGINSYECSLPTLVDNITPIFMTCTYRSSMLVDSRHNVWVSGISPFLSIYTTTFIKLPEIKAKFISMSTDLIAIIDLEDNIKIWNYGFNKHRLVYNVLLEGISEKVKYVKCSTGELVIIDMDDNIYVLSINNSVIQIPNVKAKHVAFNWYLFFILTIDNNILMIDDSGLLMEGFKTKEIFKLDNIKAKQIAVSASFLFFIDFDNMVWLYYKHVWDPLKSTPKLGSIKFTKSPMLISLNIEAKDISCHTSNDMLFIIDLDDNIWTIGMNEDLELGLSNTNIKELTQLPNFKCSKIVHCTHMMMIGTKL